MTATDETKLALARRAVACKGWRLCPGMLLRATGHPSARVECLDDGDYGLTVCPGPDGPELHSALEWSCHPFLKRGQLDGWLPDLDDPATLGCLLGLVREAWGDPDVPVMRSAPGLSHRYTCWSGPGLSKLATGDSEAEALVAALEAAPAP